MPRRGRSEDAWSRNSEAASRHIGDAKSRSRSERTLGRNKVELTGRVPLLRRSQDQCTRGVRLANSAPEAQEIHQLDRPTPALVCAEAHRVDAVQSRCTEERRRGTNV